MVNPFCPTRLNIADDPTRDRTLRPSAPALTALPLSLEQIYELAVLPRLHRWSSNWARLIILLNPKSILKLRDRSLYRRTSVHQVRSGFQHSPRLDFSCLDFDSTLGYLGEGPGFSSPRPGPWISPWISALLCIIGFSLSSPPLPLFPLSCLGLGWGCSCPLRTCFAAGCLISSPPTGPP